MSTEVPLADACVTEWRYTSCTDTIEREVPLADACVTEWRGASVFSLAKPRKVPLADACVTEWRDLFFAADASQRTVPLADACVTEWRPPRFRVKSYIIQCHSLMLVLLNGGSFAANLIWN